MVWYKKHIGILFAVIINIQACFGAFTTLFRFAFSPSFSESVWFLFVIGMFHFLTVSSYLDSCLRLIYVMLHISAFEKSKVVVAYEYIWG